MAKDKPMMSVDEYRAVFSEDWQLSQFWCVICSVLII
jgi:hypothetical protein